MSASIERRFTPGHVELRTSSSGRPLIRGYAAMFNTRSENLGGFVEIISKGAFDDVLKDDVRALFNHDSNLILGRTKSGTCRLSVDNTGLAYEIDPPDTQTAKDLMVSLKRGDVDQSSFAFSVRREDQDWKDEGNVVIRTIRKIAKLYDVSPVTYPAYPDTTVAAREMQKLRSNGASNPQSTNADVRNRELVLSEIELGFTYNPERSADANRRELQLLLAAA